MNDAISLPAAPAVPGLSFRPLHGEEDAAALSAVHTGRQERDAVDPLSTLEWVPQPDDLRPGLAGVIEAGQQDRYCIAQVGEEVAGYGRVSSWREADGTWVYLCLGWVLPQWRGRGIGTALLHWAEGLSRRLAAEEHPGERAELAANASSTEHEATALLHNEGYYVGYTALAMILDPAAAVPDLPLPAGFTSRLALPSDFPGIAASVDEAYRFDNPGGRFGEDFDPAGYVVELSGSRCDPTLWQVAWAGDEVAGQVIPVVSRGRAEVFEVSVRPAYRRRGLARALLCRALRGLRERAVYDIRLHTQDDFPTRAQDLYRSVGFRLHKAFPRYRKDL
jgi:ribosomal protein S18 acetylase RimI-like enzyme